MLRGTREDAGVLRDGSGHQQKFNTPLESLKIEFRRGVQRVQPHKYVSAEYNQRNAGYDDLDAGHRRDPGLSAISGGAPTSGGQISSTFEPRILQFGLKILY